MAEDDPDADPDDPNPFPSPGPDASRNDSGAGARPWPPRPRRRRSPAPRWRPSSPGRTARAGAARTRRQTKPVNPGPAGTPGPTSPPGRSPPEAGSQNRSRPGRRATLRTWATGRTRRRNRAAALPAWPRSRPSHLVCGRNSRPVPRCPAAAAARSGRSAPPMPGRRPAGRWTRPTSPAASPPSAGRRTRSRPAAAPAAGPPRGRPPRERPPRGRPPGRPARAVLTRVGAGSSGTTLTARWPRNRSARPAGGPAAAAARRRSSARPRWRPAGPPAHGGAAPR